MGSESDGRNTEDHTIIMTMPRVSIVMATWNWSAALRLAIRSALGQSFEDFELLVMGDGCTDDSAEIVAEFDDPRVQWHNLPERAGGQFAPNNAGLERARGEYVAYHGHDDLWHPRHLAEVVRTLDESRADLAYSGAILYGAPETGMLAITGMSDIDRGPLLQHVPPSSFGHRRSAATEIGGWRDNSALEVSTDYDLLSRIHALRGAVARTGRITVFKFPASWRRDVYKHRGAGEQEALLRRMQNEPDFLERELASVVSAFIEHRVLPPPKLLKLPAGQLSNITRQFKGAAAADNGDLERVERLRYEFKRLQQGMEWHPPERHPHFGPYQWSGPSTRSSLDFPLRTDRDLDLSLQLLSPLADDVLESLRLTVNDDPVPLERTPEESGAWRLRGRIPRETLQKAERATRFTFEISRTITPSDLDPESDDYRRLGLPFNWLEVIPAGA